MVREKVTVDTRTLQWNCVESRIDNKRFYYGRFILSPLLKGQADTIGIAMRRALIGEIDGTCITRAKSDKIPHEYSTIVGIHESVHEILMNLKEIVLRSNLYGPCDASICIKGPAYVTAQDIISPPSVEIIDNTQYIASLTEPIQFCIRLQIEKNRGYRLKTLQNLQDGNSSIDAVFMPVRNVNHSIHSYGNEKHEILFLEIWTNGSLTPKEALHEVSRNLVDLVTPFLHVEEENLYLENNQDKVTLPFFSLHNRLTKLKKKKEKRTLKYIFIDQSELSPRVYNCLKRSNIHTLLDFLTKSQEDLMKMKHFPTKDVNQIWGILEKHLEINLSKNKIEFLTKPIIVGIDPESN